jgi:uncharacterized protein (TIGR02246 family)
MIFVMDQPPEQIHRSFEEAFNRHDLDGLCALYEPEAVLVTRPVHGLAAIRELYRGVFATRPSIVLHTLAANRMGELAMLHGKWLSTGTRSDGTEIRREGRNTETVRRHPDGRWLFVIDNPSVPE